MPKGFRRVITGRTDAGRSVVIVDDRIGVGPLGAADFFKTTSAPASVEATDQVGLSGSFSLEPPPAGTVFRFFEIPPQPSAQDPEMAERTATAAFAEAGASHCRVDTARHPMMHATSSIDYVVVLVGEVWLLLDEGDELKLRPFDVVIQRATNHYWINRGDQPALLAGVLVDAT